MKNAKEPNSPPGTKCTVIISPSFIIIIIGIENIPQTSHIDIIKLFLTKYYDIIPKSDKIVAIGIELGVYSSHFSTEIFFT